MLSIFSAGLAGTSRSTLVDVINAKLEEEGKANAETQHTLVYM